MWLMVNAKGYAFSGLPGEIGQFDAVAVDGSRIVAVGGTNELSLQLGAAAKVIDMEGAVILPGLVDSHLHLAEFGKHIGELDLSTITSKSDLLQSIQKHAATLAANQWIVGGGWDENRWSDALPTLAELDEASLGHPLLLTRVCYHAYMANTLAFLAAGLGMSPDDPTDGRYGRDETGRVNGYVYDNASAPLLRAMPNLTRGQWTEALRGAMKQALAAGLTAVHSDDARSFGNFTDTWLSYHHLIRGEGLLLRVHELVDFSFVDEAATAQSSLPAADDWLERGAAKLFADGSLGGSTAWLREPYSRVAGSAGGMNLDELNQWRGTPMYQLEELRHRVTSAHRLGMPVAIHAIGDAALGMALQALAEAPRIGLRDRVVHAELVSPDLLERMAEFQDSLAIDVQPRFVVSDFPWVMDRLGTHRSAYVGAWGQMMKTKLHLCGGSDAPIEPLQPLLGIHAAVTRQKPDVSGPGFFMEEALTPAQAITLFSRGACFANHSEQRKGSIQPGWLADFTVLDRDVVNPADVNDIRDAQVLHTIVGGQFAYSVDAPL